MQDDQLRYHRQTLLTDWGPQGQQRLAAAHAVIVGCGAIGSPAADLLARAGVGTITLIDRDTVEPTNLHRQTLYTEHDALEHIPKAEAARLRLESINSQIRVIARVADLSSPSAQRLLLPSDAPRPAVILDGTDNFETRFLLNDLAVRERIPYLYAGAVGTRAMAMPILPDEQDMPCLRCIFRDVPPAGSQPTCDTAGVLGPIVVMIGAYQAAEALKIMLGLPHRLSRSLLEFDLWETHRRRVELKGTRDVSCPCCANQSYDFLESAAATEPVSLCGRDSVQITPPRSASDEGTRLDLKELASRLEPLADLTANAFLLKARIRGENTELTVFRDGRALIHGTTDPAKARAIYARYISG